MDACVSERKGGYMAKVRTHGRATPMLERSWKEEEGGRFLPRSCSILLEHGPAASCRLVIYGGTSDTAPAYF